ncbi:alpha/beta fold hydrolase [Zunongwangia endophytica]|uniref:Alpha/beta fold hydrolase n=1 Tax=Zunongwangia endophytica TaxID=1808945 RepID=A0ABV8H3W1_9FLAO|nr:alpha/beta hydrolase [Zunongwangia endophytica]MDN3595741.1 alpha/beta fold hydrolase [Zunongwangia endophytica]
MKIQHKITQIKFNSKGKGNPLVLLHGFLEDNKIWRIYQEILSKSRQVITIDLLGHGESGSIGEVHSMEEMCDAVIAVLDYLEIEKASFGGHSMGGYVIMEILKKYPEKITNISLINSSPAEDTPEKKENRDRVANLAKKNKEAFVSMAISNLLTSDNNKKFKPEIELLKTEAQKMSSENIVAATIGMKERQDSIKAFKQFQGDKFIILGMQDPVLDIDKTIEIATSTNANLIEFPDGHLSFIENKDQLLHFLQSKG